MSSQVIGNQLVFTFACGTVVRLKLEPEPTCSLNPSIDVLELMRATLLCCNRTFQEQGIARLICGFHKDLIGESVALRIRAIQRETMRWPDLSLEESEGFATEIVQYVRLYASNAKVMSSTLYAPHMIHMEDTLAMAVLNQMAFQSEATIHTIELLLDTDIVGFLIEKLKLGKEQETNHVRARQLLDRFNTFLTDRPAHRHIQQLDAIQTYLALQIDMADE